MSDREFVELTQTPIDDGALRSIARIVRGCAEMEDIITLFICGLSGISESHATALLGRSNVRTRLNIALYLAKMRDDDALDVYKKTFDAEFENTLACRNAVAHGALMGINKEGQYCFLTAKTLDPEEGATLHVVDCYSANALAVIAQKLEDEIPKLERELQVDTLRETRRKRPPWRDPKDQNRRR
jgi:hypothetical protein